MNIRNIEDAKEADAAVIKWMLDHSCMPGFHISLERAFAKYSDASPQIFHCWLDIVTNLAILELDYFDVSAYWNDSIKHDGSGTYAEFTLAERLDFHRAVTTFVIRYRSLWDKNFGVIILYTFPEQYEAYISAKSKRRFFVNLFKKHATAEELVWIDKLDGELVRFENLFRTPEMHGAGKARKWTFSLNAFELDGENPMVFLFHMYSRLFQEFDALAKQAGIDAPVQPADPNKKTMKVVVPSKKKKMEPVEVPSSMMSSMDFGSLGKGKKMEPGS